MMTLEEAIRHTKEVSESQYVCEECQKEHKQLAEWLKQLKEYQHLEKDGKLIKLPCKAGDKLYEVYWADSTKCSLYQKECDEDCDYNCDSVEKCDIRKVFSVRLIEMRSVDEIVGIMESVGERFFLTAPEAIEKQHELSLKGRM